MGDLNKEDNAFLLELLENDDTLTEEEQTLLMDRIEGGVPQVSPEEQAKQAAFTSVDDRIRMDPTGFQGPEFVGAGGALGLGGRRKATQERPDKFILAENASAAGVDVTTGLDPRTRAAAALLGFDEGAQLGAINAMVRKDLKGVPADYPVVGKDPATGEPMFLKQSPDGSLRYTLVNPPGLQGSDVIEFAGELPTIVLETGGAIAGGVIGSAAPGAGTVAGTVIGAGIGGALSIPVRLGIARAVGIPKELVEDVNLSDEAFKQLLFSSGGELAGFAVLGSVSAARNFFGRPLDVKDLPMLEKSIRDNLKKVRDLEERTGAKFDPSLGELSGDPDLLIAEANLKRDIKGRQAEKMRAAEVRSDKAGVTALRDMATQEVRTPYDEGFRSVEGVSEEARRRLVEDPDAILRGDRDAGQQALDDETLMRAHDADLVEMRSIRDATAAKADKMTEIEENAWDYYRKKAGWNPDTRRSAAVLDNRGETPIRQVMARLAQDGQSAQLASLRNAHQSTVANAGFPTQPGAVVDPANLQGLAAETLDLYHLHGTLSHMKRELRAVENGTGTNGWEARDLRDVIGALEQQIGSSGIISGNTGRALSAGKQASIREAWTNANAATEELHRVFDTKNMTTLMEARLIKTAEGTVVELPNLPAGMIRRRMMTPNDARFMTETLDAIGHEPRAVHALRNELRKLHADTVVVDGRFQQGLHNKFMDEYSDHMRSLGVGDDIDNLAGFGRKVNKSKLELERLEGRLKEMYGKNVADPTKPLNIAEEIISDRVTPGQARRILKDLDRVDPRLGQDVREKIQEQIFADMTGDTGKVINHASLNKMLRTQRDTLTAAFGSQYVKDLDSLNVVLSIMGERKFAKTSGVRLQSHFMALTRSLFGPLSKKQRFATAIQRFARNTRSGRVMDILANPESMRRFIRLKNLTVNDPRYWTTVISLGLVDEATNSSREAGAAFERFKANFGEVQQQRREAGL